ncbi:MAG: GatB/YqeY domain-containing protein [Patescibacteria group bacterium]|jgi:hypothetical protein|nr:GatB/YqeY domain-containing protein [Patescibacteria group bacterium]
MTLLEIIEKNFKEALKQKKAEDLIVLRGLKTVIHNKEIELNAQKKELKEENVLELIRREAKKRNEAIELYKQGNREDLVVKEKKEIDILKRYLPTEISEEEIKTVILEVIKEIGAGERQDFGKVMGLAMSRLKGRAEGDKVKELVEKELF